ncbi:MAG TPA: hypothetical protein VH186_17120 [Chloroflexia bacterium]|nr:hypothetical protein [Chloroflexia bacterium]
MLNEEKYRCRVCGLLYPEPPWGEDGKSPSFDICECCGAEWGYEDCTIKGIRTYRERWIAEGAKWFEPKAKPEGWKLEEQLKMIPEEYL